MFKLQVKLAIANILKYKTNTLIGILGFTLGFVCFIFIFLHVSDEFKYDKFHSKSDRIYRIIHKYDMGDSGESTVSCPFPVGPSMKNEYSNIIEEVVRLYNWWGESYTLTFENQRFIENKLVFADSSLFKVFDFQLIEGDPVSVLNGPNKVVLAESAAKKYFSNIQNALGKSLKVNNEYSIIVTGVIKDMPKQSHFNFDIICSLETYDALNGREINNWWWCNPAWTYILLKEGANSNQLKAKLDTFVNKYVPEDQRENTSFMLQALEDIHFFSHFDGEIQQNSNYTMIYLLIAISTIILLLSIANYINLSTAISGLRSKEIGIRKILGSSKKILIIQFLTESIILVLISAVITISIVVLLLPYYNNIVNKELSYFDILNAKFILLVLSIMLGSGIIAGLYPAFILSSINPLMSIKENFNKKFGKLTIRQLLIILQFVLSTSMIFGCIVILKQVNYLKNMDIGFQKENVLVINVINTSLMQNAQSFIEELSKNPKIKNPSFVQSIPGKDFNYNFCYPEGLPEHDKRQLYFIDRVQHDFINTLNIELVAGRNFSRSYTSDYKNAVLINESLVKQLGWSNKNAIGKKMKILDGNEVVIGVIKDFNFHSLHKKVEPLVVDLVGDDSKSIAYAIMKISPEDKQETINYIKGIYESLVLETPFEYFFLEDYLDDLYKNEKKLSKVSIIFSLFAIVIATLGVIGLFRFIIERKIRFIAIRIVFGSSASNIVKLLSKEFLGLIIVSSLIAFPIVAIIFNKWLQNFYFHIEYNVWMFLVSFILVASFPIIIIVFYSYRIAIINPIKSLKVE